MIFITGVIYPIPVYWVWGDGYLSAEVGFIDFAGSAVVHGCGAFAGLAYIIVLGNRTGFTADGPEPLLSPTFQKLQDEADKVGDNDGNAARLYTMVGGGWTATKRLCRRW